MTMEPERGSGPTFDICPPFARQFATFVHVPRGQPLRNPAPRHRRSVQTGSRIFSAISRIHRVVFRLTADLNREQVMVSLTRNRP